MLSTLFSLESRGEWIICGDMTSVCFRCLICYSDIECRWKGLFGGKSSFKGNYCLDCFCFGVIKFRGKLREVRMFWYLLGTMGDKDVWFLKVLFRRPGL